MSLSCLRMNAVRASNIVATLAFTLLASCASDDAAKGNTEGAIEQSLRRVEIASASFVELRTEVMVRLANPGTKTATFESADVELKILGPVPPEEGDDDESEEGDEEATDGEEADEAASDDEGSDEESEGAASSETLDGVTGVAFRGNSSGGEVRAGEQAEVRIPVTIPLPSDPEALKAFLEWGQVRVEVKGTISRSNGTETFSGVREIALPRFPKAILKEAQVASVDEGAKGVVFFTLGIDNPNAFEVPVDAFAYSVTVGDKELRPMGEGVPQSIPPGSVETFEDSIDLDETSYSKDVKKLLRQPAIPYRIEGYQEIRGVRLPFKFEGEMAFAR